MGLLDYENEYLAKGVRYICGVDEVGRGPLAGPVVVGAVIADLEKIIAGVNDSKKLSDKKRRLIYPQILDTALSYKTVAVSNEQIDKMNILEATKLAMRQAVEGLSIVPDIVFIDAVKLDLPVPTLPIIHGDALSYSIGMASILAKVERDDMMIEYAKLYPEYGFEVNKGYGTAYHIQMLKKYGACPIHRESFIKNFKDMIEGHKYGA